MISCPKCAKENQDHYKFCLGCGAELPRGGAPKVFSPQTPPHGIRAVEPSAPAPAAIAHTPPSVAPRPVAIPRPEPVPVVQTPSVPAPAAIPSTPAPAPAPAPVAEPAAAAGTVTCPQCSHQNIPANRFCASCGYNLGVARSSAPAPAAAPAVASTAPVAPVKLTALRPDGSDLGTYTLPVGTATVGRDVGGIFAGDSYLSPRHATFETQNGNIVVRDEGSLNGVYRKIAPLTPVELVDGSIFRIGQEIVRFEALKPEPAGPDGVERLGSPSNGYVGRIALLIGRETTGNAFPVPEHGIHIGRERGDVLFPEDGYVSGLHCRITVEEGRVWLTDVGSSNGTFLRIQGEQEIQPGEILLMGQQLYRVER